MKIATWNINSIRIREEGLQRLVTAHAPDILCLQETKVEDAHFPQDMVAQLGFAHCLFTGEKSYNGVAILSKIRLKLHATFDILGNGSKRHIAAALPDGTLLHNFYIPAGGDIPDVALNPKFEEKLRFVDQLRDWSRQEIKQSHRVIAVGDFNIAPGEHDVWSHKQLLSVVSHTPVEVDKLRDFQAQSGGWIDAIRHFTPDHQKLYSWWSYRNRDWEKSDRGRRLDHIWLTPALRQNLISAHIFRDARNFPSPSDHVPVMVEI